jgi:hypothetical protein
MVASTAAPAVELLGTQSNLLDSPAAQAGIAAYIASGERVRALTDLAWKLCVGLIVLIVVAWAVGALPAAVKLF